MKLDRHRNIFTKATRPLTVGIYAALLILAQPTHASEAECVQHLPTDVDKRQEMKDYAVNLFIRESSRYLMDTVPNVLQNSHVNKEYVRRMTIIKNQLKERGVVPYYVLSEDDQPFLPNIIDVDERLWPENANYFYCMLDKGHDYLLRQSAEPLNEIITYLSQRVFTADAGHFGVKINGCVASPVVRTGNQFADIKAPKGSQYVILDVSYKNNSTISRVAYPGSLVIGINGAVYEFDNTEAVYSEGFGLPRSGLNPLIAHRTKLVYRVPSDISGLVFWEPENNIRLLCPAQPFLE